VVYNIHVKCSVKFVFEEKFEDTKDVIRIYNTVIERKRTKYNKLHRKLKIDQHVIN